MHRLAHLERRVVLDDCVDSDQSRATQLDTQKENMAVNWTLQEIRLLIQAVCTNRYQCWYYTLPVVPPFVLCNRDWAVMDSL